MTHERKIGVIGLGYVGLPVAVSFARSGRSEQDEVQRHGYLQGKPIDSA